MLVAGHPAEEKAALHLLHVGLDADPLPLFLDHLGDLRVWHEGARGRLQLEAQPALAVGAQPIGVTVLLGEPDRVEEPIGLLHVERGPLLAPFRPWTVRQALRRRGGSGNTHSHPERLVQLVAVDAHGQRASEIARVKPPGDLGVGVVRLVRLQGGV